LTAEASEIETYLRANLPADFTPPANQVPARKPPLPTHCPSCGGAVRPDEIEWLDEVTAECDYCGSPLRSEG
jgi:NAD-dependent SIR2 family protein deacetylase